MKCSKCGGEIRDDGNWREFMGEYSHRICPGAILVCHFCGKTIPEGEEIKTSLGYKHSSCGWEPQEETEPQPRTWIARHP